MAHFALINESGVVVRVLVVPDEEEYRGEEFLQKEHGIQEKCIKTSYNTKLGIYYDPQTNEPAIDQSKAFRKNYAGIGFTFDEIRDAFIPPKPFESWVLNENSCIWEAPIPMPETGGPWEWNEELGEWE